MTSYKTESYEEKLTCDPSIESEGLRRSRWLFKVK